MPFLPSVLLLAAGVAIPVLLGVGVEKTKWGLMVLGLCMAGIGAILWLDFGKFAIWFFPAIILIESHQTQVAMVMLLVGSLLVNKLFTGKLELDLPYPLLLGFLVAIWVWGMSRSYDLDNAVHDLVLLYISSMLVFVAYYNYRPKLAEINHFLNLVCVIASIIGWMSLMQHLFLGVEREIYLWSSQNLGAYFLGLNFPLAMIRLVDARSTAGRLLWGVIFTGIGAGIAASQTRAILLGVIFAIAYLAWKDRSILRIFIPVMVLAVIAAPTLLLTRMTMLLGRGEYADWSSVGRIELWLQSWELLPGYFFQGMGIHSFEYIYNSTYPNAFLYGQHCHNLYANYIFEFGVFGLIAYVLFLYKPGWRGHKLIRSLPPGSLNQAQRTVLALTAAVLLTVLCGMVDTYLRDARAGYLLMIYLAFLLHLTRTPQADTPATANAPISTARAE